MITQIENWKTGQTGKGVAKAGYEAQQTKPPKPYTEATLLNDMKLAAKFLADPRLREILKEAEGLGTPATRAATIEKLKSMGYVELKAGKIRSTAESQAVVQGLPKVLLDPDTTAEWENMLAKIARNELDMACFMSHIVGDVNTLVGAATSSSINIPDRGGDRSVGSGKNSGAGKFGGSSRTSPRSGSEPIDTACPKCGGKLSISNQWINCEKNDFSMNSKVAGLQLSEDDISKLIKSGRTGKIAGFFSSKKQKNFEAVLIMAKDGSVSFDFGK